MVKRCKIGDRAFIVKSPFPENIGKIIIVIGIGALKDWFVRSEGSQLRCSKHIATGEIVGQGVDSHGEVNDDQLRPIRGEPEKESEKEKEVA